MMEAMPPHAMGGMTADHMGNMPQKLWLEWMDHDAYDATRGGWADARNVPPDAMGGMGPMQWR